MTDDRDTLYDRVWRKDFTAPGFAAIDAPGIDSRRLRAFMIEIRDRFSAIANERGGKRFRAASLGSFDQQVTTKFHLDGAPAESLLVLGYEPSEVVSEIRLADFSRAAHDLGLTPEEFLDRHNPMYRRTQEVLDPYTTLLRAPAPGHSRLPLINNSKLPFDGSSPLGVLHQATIPSPDRARRRVINSMMLVTEEGFTPRAIEHIFLTTDEISGPIDSRHDDHERSRREAHRQVGTVDRRFVAGETQQDPRV